MTYMSIPSGLSPAVQAGRLHCLSSLWTGFETTREIYATESVRDAVCGPFGDDDVAIDLAEFRGTLDSFLEGGYFSVAEAPFSKPADAMLARVDPVGVEMWDIRSVDPHPGIRCLGGFYSKDTFVALRWDFRSNIEDWSGEIQSCLAQWKDLFGDRNPLKGNRLDDYLSNYYPV